MIEHKSSVSVDPDVDLEKYIHHTSLPQTSISLAIGRFLNAIGSAVSWLWVILLLVVVLNVVLRYVLSKGLIEFEELQWHLYSIGFLIGLSYAYEADDHVRVDLLHDRFSLRTQAWIELYGILLLLLPFVALVLYYSWPFLVESYVSGERSSSPGGLSQRWIVKSFLFISFALLGLAAISRLLRVFALLFGAPRPIPVERKPAGHNEGLIEE